MEKDTTDSSELPIDPMKIWRGLYSYLEVKQEVLPDDKRPESNRVKVAVTIRNTAPDGVDSPQIVFKNIVLNGVPGAVQSRDTVPSGQLGPGGTSRVEFRINRNALLAFQLNVDAEIDGEALFRFNAPAENTATATTETRLGFSTQLDQIAIRDLVTEAMNTLSQADESLSYAEMGGIRDAARGLATRTREATVQVRRLIRFYQLGSSSALGAETARLSRTLALFQEKVQGFDEALGSTNMDEIKKALKDLQQAQLAVLRVEAELRSVGG